MKKLLFVIVLIMAVLAVNAQTTQTQTTKTTTTKETPVRSTVLVADLQKSLTDNFAKDYVGFTIKEAAKVTTKDIVTYEVVIAKGNATETETLVYDNEGKFVKKLPPTTPMK